MLMVVLPCAGGSFAFLQFGTEEEVETAMEQMQGAELFGRSVILDYVGQKSKNRSGGSGGRSYADGNYTDTELN